MNTHEKIINEIKNFLERLHITPDSIEIRQHKLHPIFSIQTKDSAFFTTNEGEGLHAFNYLIKRIINKEDTDEVKFLIDVNGYQEEKLKKLEQQAGLLADRARAFKHEVELSPMNAYERMVVHTLFTHDPHIKTSSVGEGKFRRVVLIYTGE
ncbi:hypothetical protein HQ403_00945 [Candidatus Kaiserbacteria bacterium]|nr:hypothetical protein [Candidatus Kaiserbacteria bacterium]